ncbi:MAG: hypothetical protein QM770_17185 [Tepidisphaeraceae bacterium]
MPTDDRSPRERLLLDRNWRFALGHAADPSKDFDFTRDRSLVKAGEARGAAGVAFDDSAWRELNLPHDWAIELPVQQDVGDDPIDQREHAEHGFVPVGPRFPATSVGWYRKTFSVPASDLGKRIVLEFDGVYRDSVVWVNGHRLGRHASGYDSFRYDITDLLHYGRDADKAEHMEHLPGVAPRPGVKPTNLNTIAVRVDATQYEGWWYEGAGIYRHVWLTKTLPVHVAHDGVFVTTESSGRNAEVTMRTQIDSVLTSRAPTHAKAPPTGRGLGRGLGANSDSHAHDHAHIDIEQEVFDASGKRVRARSRRASASIRSNRSNSRSNSPSASPNSGTSTSRTCTSS